MSERVSWKESNLALIGSDLDHKIKAAAADGETAWDVIGKDVGIFVWRIEQFRVVPVSTDDYGSFYSGDSYIVLQSYKKDDMDTLFHNIHIWIGSNSSQDEYGTAAYKMVEADEYLGGTAVQYREVQNHESSLFTSYFPNGITYKEGGAESGFTHVETIVETPRMYRIKGTMSKMSLTTMQSGVAKSNLTASDSYIVYVNNSTVYVWHGTDANGSERNTANTWAETLCTNGTVVTYDQGSEEDTFWSLFPDPESDIPSSSDIEDADVEVFESKLYQLSNSGATLVGSGSELSKSLLDTNDVFLLDSGWSITVWIGQGSDTSEKLNAISWAHTYCNSSSNDTIRTSTLPIAMMKEGYESSTFLEHFN